MDNVTEKETTDGSTKAQEESTPDLSKVVTSFGKMVESSLRRFGDDLLTRAANSTGISTNEIKEAAKDAVGKAEDAANRAWAFVEKNAPAGKSRTILLPGLDKDVQTIAESIMDYWRDFGYGVQQMRFEHEGNPATLVQIRNSLTPVGEIFRKAAGMVSCATVTLMETMDGIQVEVVSGTWIDKIGGTDPYWFLPRPMFATAAIGLYRRSAFLDDVFTDIRDRICGEIRSCMDGQGKPTKAEA